MRQHINRQYDSGFLAQDSVYLDLRMSNFCNLACQTCAEDYSSKWADLKSSKQPRISNSLRNSLDIGKISKNGMIHFAGGEPLLIRDHIEILKDLVAKKISSSIRLQFTTNLSKIPSNLLPLLKEFKSTRFCVSVDAGDSANEYIRFPVKNDDIIENFDFLSKELPDCELLIQPTISILNIFNLKSFNTFIDTLYRKTGRKIYLYPHQLHTPEIFNFLFSPESIKNEIYNEMDCCINLWKTDDRFKHFVHLLIKTKESLFSVSPKFTNKQIYNYILEMDLTRNSLLRTGNPELFEALKKKLSSDILTSS